MRRGAFLAQSYHPVDDQKLPKYRHVTAPRTGGPRGALLPHQPPKGGGSKNVGADL
jgi:hypothetical protein